MPDHEDSTGKEPTQGHSDKEIVRKDDVTPSQAIQLGGKNSELDISQLTPEQQRELRARHAKGMIDAEVRAHDIAVDAQALDKGLETMAHHTKEISKEEGLSVTLTQVREDKMGRTEVIMGNTDTASKGRLSRSQSSQKDTTLIWFALAVLVIIAIVIIAVASK